MHYVEWLEQPEFSTYIFAISFLSLLYESSQVEDLIVELKEAQVTTYRAKDIFRASGLSILGVSNSHVKKKLDKIEKGVRLSPILLVRDIENRKLIVADGYHRLCAIYTFDESSFIRCKIV